MFIHGAFLPIVARSEMAQCDRETGTHVARNVSSSMYAFILSLKYTFMRDVLVLMVMY